MGTEPRKVGTVTGAASGGAAAGAALAQIAVWAWPDAEPIEAALTVLLTLGFGFIGGWLVPPSRSGGEHSAA